MSSIARVRLILDHLLVGVLGVKRVSQAVSSKLSSCPSIQPWQSAPSTASCFERPTTPDAFFASFSQRPFDVTGWHASQASHASLDGKNRTGGPFFMSVTG